MGLKLPPRAIDLDIFSSEWVHSFHGCPNYVVSSVLQEGSLLMPGDMLMDGTKLVNRLTRGGEERIGVYTSPSIKYSELDIYTKPITWEGHEVRIVLQCRQKASSFTVEGETIGWNRKYQDTPISYFFDNDKIERFTRAKGAIIPYRILVGIDIKTREHEEHKKKEDRLQFGEHAAQEQERKRKMVAEVRQKLAFEAEQRRVQQEAKKLADEQQEKAYELYKIELTTLQLELQQARETLEKMKARFRSGKIDSFVPLEGHGIADEHCRLSLQEVPCAPSESRKGHRSTPFQKRARKFKVNITCFAPITFLRNDKLSEPSNDGKPPQLQRGISFLDAPSHQLEHGDVFMMGEAIFVFIEPGGKTLEIAFSDLVTHNRQTMKFDAAATKLQRWFRSCEKNKKRPILLTEDQAIETDQVHVRHLLLLLGTNLFPCLHARGTKKVDLRVCVCRCTSCITVLLRWKLQQS